MRNVHTRFLVLGLMLLPAGLIGCSGGSDASDSTTLASHADPAVVCATACDCDPGYACQATKCVAAKVAVYCCGASMCPVGAECQARSGKLAVCEAPAAAPPVDFGTTLSLPDLAGGISLPGLPDLGGLLGGLPDLGSTSGTSNPLCPFIPCSSSSTCTQILCSSCGSSGYCQ